MCWWGVVERGRVPFVLTRGVVSEQKVALCAVLH
jgi:hypothetical protein